MKITVAMRVIGGFAIITLLLLILGFSSMSSLYKVGDASDEVSSLALPTVAGTSNLKVAFVNMGRLAFEGFVGKDEQNALDKRNEFDASKARFDTTLQTLSDVVKNDENLRSSVANLNLMYESYVETSDAMFDSHLTSIKLKQRIEDMIAQLEENADDASSLLLDFTDLDEIQDSEALSDAATLANTVESNMLALLSVATDYAKTESLQRADIRSKEVTVVLDQTKAKFADMVNAANGEDDSGTIDEVGDLLAQISDSLESGTGLLVTKINELEQIAAADVALRAADDKISEAIVELNTLNEMADAKALKIKTSVESQVSTSTMTIIGVVLLSFAIAGGVGYMTVIAITKPLDRVNQLLKIAASGDLTHKLDDSSGDEFGTLAKNCNNLIGNLKELINAINQRADQLAAASGETSTITLQTTASIEDQKSQISQIAAATTEMHTTSELVSKSAHDTLLEIKHADAEAEKVKRISAENKDTIQVLANEVQQAAEVINKLHQDSASIGGILDVIRGVADQTNLLALNAAIEAARAGEQGRGFAVVADEVRTLASRTQQSTQEINSMIEVLQAGAEKAVSVMNQGKEQTNACVAQTEKAGEALNMITDAVHRAYEVSTRIETAAREQHTVSSQISERLENIVGIAEHTTIGAKQTAESSSEVAKLAEELQSSISQFRV
ncbi:methyl-accepting chemotaxis protein [Glaciecola siphonariae]|uniref:Methyl-accepting chemotaxis protein n=1 Tax=Glaciecola siphonariae TaxID=521012 RepID=A0ABV9M041_9ALTE